MISMTEDSRQAWRRFLQNQQNHGHVVRELAGLNIDKHVEVCFASSLSTVERIKRDLPPDFHPSTILEVGCSSGLNCLALQEHFPTARVIGIEPETEAIRAAESMLVSNVGDISPEFIEGFGENLPLKTGSIDLIVCHTVIEHVRNVSEVISEMSRVLSNKGVIHIEAPNYVYPYEPHLQIFTIPLFGKGFVKITALMQGKRLHLGFLDHLQFVTPGYLEQQFRRNGLEWENRAIQKLHEAATGKADIKKYRAAANILAMLNKFGIEKLFINLIGSLGLYPSVMYTLYKSKSFK